MKSRIILMLILSVSALPVAFAQEQLIAAASGNFIASSTTDLPKKNNQQIVRVTGVRFAYPLVQKWIDDFNKEYPDIQVIIEARASADPSQYEVLIEAYEHAEEVKKDREYAYIGRYAVLPVSNSKSALAKIYADKGLDKDLIVQLFFHDIYA